MKRERDPETGLPIISTPGNGKRWAWDTIGKAVAGVLVFIALAIWGRFITIYGLPPRVDALELAVKAPRPMSSPEVEALGKAVAAEVLAALPPAKKAKP